MKVSNYCLVAILLIWSIPSLLLLKTFQQQENLKAQILELEVSANNKRNQKSEKERLLGQKKMSLRNCLDR